ncbi:DNA sulfur modification protein DndD [Methylomonas sp. MED-D]|uniref:DNA sulfur modification protein DndD n=1 Tax=Methylomonas sp. MED-D TaxID=3418768 RepID=UPI003D065A3B
MILKSLKVVNFRVFNGTHEFDLTPRLRHGIQLPIILFGGLNGAGKTTTLTAIRLALYGRQSLGVGTTQNEYHQFLVDSVHHSKVTGIQAHNASVELVFSYAHLGVISHYHVQRSWTITNSNVAESLIVLHDNRPIQNLSYEQAQGFLNELIPIGVSDLFFFDGEKIAQLAEDNDGNALGQSVKKLIGLDIVEKLIADITVYIRNQNKHRMSDDIKARIINLEQLLDTQEQLIEIEQNEYESLKLLLDKASKNVDQLTNNLNAHGGAWAASREEEIKKISGYSAERDLLNTQIREIISENFPFSIAPDFISLCLDQLDNEKQLKLNNSIASVLVDHIESLKTRLSSIVDGKTMAVLTKEIDKEFVELTSARTDLQLIHDVSDTIHQKISAISLDSINYKRKRLKQLASNLRAVNQKIDEAGINIARAPDKGLLNIRLQELSEAQSQHVNLVAQASQQKEKIRTHLREAIKTVRALEKLHDSFVFSDDNDRALDYAHKAKNALTQFAERVAINKIKNVETEFINSFKRLARKEDINIKAKIEPHAFSVKLLNDFGNEIPKESLSAGERQIYAVAMLDALAKTSGRKLPIIIDTPLGRLDSKHRKKLVENYFPRASHQVIILSTDTEIGESYLASLKHHISHSIMLDYSASQGASNIEEGYFWNSSEIA